LSTSTTPLGDAKWVSRSPSFRASTFIERMNVHLSPPAAIASASASSFPE